MRTIKFRGKRKDNGMWVYGDLVTTLTPKGSMTKSPAIHTRIGTIGTFFVQLDTVGQFTGLTDADGREIYEGDILFMGCDNGENIYNEVGIKDGCFGYIGEVTGKLIPFCNHDVTEIIAGNIHDNPELLKGGDHEN